MVTYPSHFFMLFVHVRRLVQSLVLMFLIQKKYILLLYTTTMTNLKCKRCGHEWDYAGKRKWYATCPDCKTSVKIKAE